MLVVQRDKLRPARKKFEILLDSNELKWFYMFCAAALPQLDRGSDYESERHRFESYTPHQSNLKPPATGAFLLGGRRMDSNLGRGAGVKKTRSVFSPRASPPAGGRVRRQAGEAGADPRSGCAEYYTPHQLKLKASGNGGFSFTPAGGRSRCGSARQLNQRSVKIFQIVA